MSYIRAGYPMRYVDGVSVDYVYLTWDGEQNVVDDCGSLSDDGFVELLFRYAERRKARLPIEQEFEDYILRQASKRPLDELSKKILWRWVDNRQGSDDEIVIMMVAIARTLRVPLRSRPLSVDEQMQHMARR